MLSQALLSLAALPLLVSAHFLLEYPIVRGFDEDILGTFPCGGQNNVSPNRTSVSMSSIPVALKMGHDQTVIQVLLGLGNDVGDSFNIILEPTFYQQGLGFFCLPDVPIPAGLNITAGMNATLQVVTDGEGGGGLYNCADITFTSMAEMVPSSCINGTGVSASALPSAEAALNANQSVATGGPASGSTGAAATSTGSGAAASSSGDAVKMTVAWGGLGAVLLGAAVLL